MAQLPQPGNTGFTLGGFLILAALGTFLWKGAPLDSVRPSSEQSGWYEHKLAQQIPARLWQDPFKAVYAHEQAIKSGTSTTSYDQDPGSEIIKLQTMGDKAEVNLLMVMLTPGSYAELEERRRRRRYAVLSGLGEEHFVPRNAEMLSVLYRPNINATVSDCFPEDNSANRNTPSKECYSIPYEWYDYEGPVDETGRQRQVLVFWLNESHFVDSPLKRIKDFLFYLLPTPLSIPLANEITLRASLLGPGRSDALRNLVTKKETEAYAWLRDESGLTEFNIISSTATVADADLISKWRTDTTSEQQTPSPLLKLYPEFSGSDCDKNQASRLPKKPCMRFLRTIRSDDVLIKKLATELISKRSIDTKEDYVVVISEWDTYFGRSLPLAFERYFCENGCGNNNVVRYNYQRGMDGSIAGEQNAAKQPAGNNQPKANKGSPSIDEATMRRPVGPGQFDYLRRLAADIQKKDREWRLESGHGVRAVVLLGSDVYDKLLILRALRPGLPGAIFATTDLDAQLLHPAEFSWTRNMIVASTYDLSLSPQIAMTTMPFRDSYQTSIYLATRLIFNKKMQTDVDRLPFPDCYQTFIYRDCYQKSIQKSIYLATRLIFNEKMQADVAFDQQRVFQKIPPQLMEIGRQTLVTLADEEDSSLTWNHVLIKSFVPAVSLGLFTIAALGIFAFHQLKPKAGRATIVLVAVLLLFSAVSILIAQNNIAGEPLAFLAGASIWPAEYIRLFGVMLSLVFIWSVIHILHRSWSDLGVRYFWQGSKVNDDGLTINEIWLALKQNTRHPIQHLKSIKCTQVLPVIMIVILIAIMKIVLPIQLALFHKILLLIAVWGVLITFWWALIYGHIKKDFRVLSVNKWVSKCVPGNKDAVEMWRSYGEYGAGDQRFLRAIAYILIYFAFASMIFSLLGSPASPCRGGFACSIDKIILGFSVLSMLVLLFLVVDAARLCICWVDSMHKNEIDWSNTRKNEYIQRLKLPDTHAIAWIKVHLIGERTSEVTSLIYFPVLIILLLLLARSTYFDNWDFPQALAIVIGLNFIIALGSVVRLNFVAKSTRGEILRELQDEELAADRIEDVSYEPSSSERQELIHQLESLRIGAYLPVWDQPPVRATLMLLGGVALTYAEYLTVFLK